VLAAGVDYLADAAAIAVSLFAIQQAHRPERSAAHANATNIAALVNAGWLLALSVWIAAAAARRLVSGVPEVRGPPVLIVSALAAVVMLAGALIVGTDGSVQAAAGNVMSDSLPRYSNEERVTEKGRPGLRQSQCLIADTFLVPSASPRGNPSAADKQIAP
jgi:Co/Zn/Cd efflux system component